MPTIQMLKKNSIVQAMTLLEVLIAIFVMGIGILSIIKLMTYNIQTIARVHAQTIATSLAREGLEMVNNVRDTNILLGYERNCAQRSSKEEIQMANENTPLCKSFFRTGDNTEYYYTIDGGISSSQQQISMQRVYQENLQEKSQLTLSGITINNIIVNAYVHGEKNIENSKFSRYIEFHGLSGLDRTPISKKDIHSVRSVVFYNYGIGTGKIMLESFIAHK